MIHTTLPSGANKKARTRVARALREHPSRFFVVIASHHEIDESDLGALLLHRAGGFFVVPASQDADRIVCCGGGGELSRAVREKCCSAITAHAKAQAAAGDPYCQFARDPTKLAELVAGTDSTPSGTLLQLFPSVPAAVRSELQLDAEARYSVSDEPTADAITAAVLALPGVSKRTVVVDATACVGGSTLSFSKSFETVYAIEVDESRHGMLAHNCNLLSKSVAMGTVHTRHGDCLQVVPKIAKKLHSTAAAGSSSSSASSAATNGKRAAAATASSSSGFVIFLDPPWGGRAYKATPQVTSSSLSLSGKPLPQVMATFLALPGCLCCVCRVPKQYDLADLHQASGSATPRVLSLPGNNGVCVMLLSKRLATTTTTEASSKAAVAKAAVAKAVAKAEAEAVAAEEEEAPAAAQSKSSLKKKRKCEKAAARRAAAGANGNGAAPSSSAAPSAKAQRRLEEDLDDIFRPVLGEEGRS